MKKNRLASSLALTISLSVSGYASASMALIDFNNLGDYPIPEATYGLADHYLDMRSINLSGFTIIPNGSAPFTMDVPNYMEVVRSSLYGPADSLNAPWNGTDYLYFWPGIKINQIGDLPFSLNSFDLAIWQSSADTAFDDAVVIGTLVDGMTISQTIALDTIPNELKTIGNDFMHYSLTGFENLQSAAISWSGSGYYRFGIDNIDLTSSPAPDPIPSLVPEPQTYAMLLAGIGLIGFFFRKKEKLSA